MNISVTYELNTNDPDYYTMKFYVCKTVLVLVVSFCPHFWTPEQIYSENIDRIVNNIGF